MLQAAGGWTVPAQSTMLPRHHSPPRGDFERLRKKLSRRSWLRQRAGCFRCAALILVGAGFLAMQAVFFASLLPNVNTEAADVSKELIATVLRKFVEPIADAAAAAPDEIDEAGAESESLLPPPARPPPAVAFGGGLRRPAKVWGTAKTVSTADNSRAFAWDFKLATTFSHEVKLHGCVGNGTYGSVLNASLGRRGKPIVVKLPVLRHWGFRFYRAELRALEAVESLNTGDRGARNVIRSFVFDDQIFP